MKTSRREFLQMSGQAAAGLVVLGVTPGCESFDLTPGDVDRSFNFLTRQHSPDWFWFSALEDSPSRSPRISTEDWTLEIRSGGRSVGEIGYRKLKALEADGHAISYIKTMRCIFGAFAGSIPDTLAATGVFRGIPLKLLLDDQSISGEVTKLRLEAYDGFTTSLSYDRLLDEEQLPVILAFEINGEPITRERGGPVRVIVPEMWAFKSIKWVSAVDATTDFSTYGTFETGPFAGKGTVDNPGLMSLVTLVNEPKSLFADVKGPDVTLSGMTMVGGTKVDAVEVKVGDNDWELATIASFDDVLASIGHDGLLVRSCAQYGQDWPYPNVWAPWTHTLTGLTPGRHIINLRAVDRLGRSQPSFVDNPHELAQQLQLELEVT